MSVAAGSYNVYGLRLHSAWKLPYPKGLAPWLADVSLVKGSDAQFAAALRTADLPRVPSPWATAPLPDGTTYLRWQRLFEFLIQPDGRSVVCRPLSDRAIDAFHTHLGPSLSFALINLGVEPLHSTTVVIDGQAVALMGDCGYGKSTLGAEFLRAGHQLLTDDLLVLRDTRDGFLAYPGAPRVKLYPEMARRVLGAKVKGLRLKGLTPKLIVPLDARRGRRTITPLKAIYVLTPPSGSRGAQSRGSNGAGGAHRGAAPAGVRIRTLTPRQACLELVRNTFNMAVEDTGRLQRQFAQATRVALTIPVKSLSYPRHFRMLSEAREAILADLEQ
jgi:hypothetical protein